MTSDVLKIRVPADFQLGVFSLKKLHLKQSNSGFHAA